jgi:hypothetical protein
MGIEGLMAKNEEDHLIVRFSKSSRTGQIVVSVSDEESEL